MKVKNQVTKVEIEVSQEHYDQVLSRQGWIQVIPLVEELKKEIIKSKGATK